MSNWERRPLRESQKHYGALGAICLIDIFEKLENIAKSQNQNTIEETITENPSKELPTRMKIPIGRGEAWG